MESRTSNLIYTPSITSRSVRSSASRDDGYIHMETFTRRYRRVNNVINNHTEKIDSLRKTIHDEKISHDKYKEMIGSRKEGVLQRADSLLDRQAIINAFDLSEEHAQDKREQALSEQKQVEEQIKQIQDEISEVLQQIEQNTEEAKQLEYPLEYKSLECINKALKSRYEDSNDYSIKIQGQINQMSNEITHLEQKEAELIARRDGIIKRLEDIEIKETKAMERLSQPLDDIKQIQELLDQIINDTKAAEQRLIKAKPVVVDQATRRAQIEQERIDLKNSKRRSLLERRLEAIRQEKNTIQPIEIIEPITLEETKDSLESTIDSLMEKQKTYQNQLNELDDYENKIQAERKNVQQDYNEKVTKLDQLRYNVQDYEQVNYEIQSNIELIDHMKQVYQNLKQTSTKLERRTQKANVSKDSIYELNPQIAGLQEDLSKMAVKLEEQKEKNIMRKQTYSQNKQEVSELEQKFKEQSETVKEMENQIFELGEKIKDSVSELENQKMLLEKAIASQDK